MKSPWRKLLRQALPVLLPAVVVAFSATTTRAQGGRHDGMVLTARGPAAGATVTVCTEAATGTPCTPLATIYTDKTLTTVAANPATSDGLGNFGFWAAPGTYKVTFTGPGITAFTQTVMIPCSPGTNCDLSSVGGVINANQVAGADIGAKINTAVGLLPSTGGKITCERGSHNFATPIVFAGKDISLECAGSGFSEAGASHYGTRLVWTGGAPISRTITTISRTANVVTVTTSAVHGFSVGWPVTVTGVADTGFNGLFQVVSAPTTTTFTYAQNAANATSSGGTAVGGGVAITVIGLQGSVGNVSARLSRFALENTGSGAVGIDVGEFAQHVIIEDVQSIANPTVPWSDSCIRLGNANLVVDVTLRDVWCREHAVGLRAVEVGGHLVLDHSRFMNHTTNDVVLGLSANKLVASFHSFGSTYEVAPLKTAVLIQSALKADFVSDYWECDGVDNWCIDIPSTATYARGISVRGAYMVGAANGSMSAEFARINLGAADLSVSDSYFTRFGASSAITSASRSANVVTLTLPTGHTFQINSIVNVTGVTPASFNGGPFTVTARTATTIQYSQTGANESGTGGSVSATGYIVRNLAAASVTLIANRLDPDPPGVPMDLATSYASVIVLGNTTNTTLQPSRLPTGIAGSLAIGGPSPWYDVTNPVHSGGASGSAQSTTGNITASQTTLTLTAAQDFRNGQGVAVFGAGALPSITTPTGLTVVAQGTTGSTTYSYQVAAIDNKGGLTAPTTVVTISNGNATLSNTNFNRLTWNSVTGAVMYAIYGRSGSLVAIGIAGPVPSGTQTFDDKGINFQVPSYVPSAVPGAATAQILTAKISSGAGTTTLTLDTAATTTVSGKTVQHDETAAVNAAINSCSATGGVVYIPMGTYNLGALVFPTTMKWCIVKFNATLMPLVPIKMDKRGYALVGEATSLNVSFQRWPAAVIGHNSLNPVVEVNTGAVGGVYLEGFVMANIVGDGILIHGGSPNVTLSRIAIASGSAANGSPIRIKDSFGFYMDNMVLYAPTSTPRASLDLTGPAGAGATRILYLRNSMLGKRGVKIGPTTAEAGIISSFAFSNILTEDFEEPFVTIDSTNAGGKISGILLENIEMADTIGSQNLILNTGANTANVTAINPVGVLNIMSGTAISGLAIINPHPNLTEANVGQSTNFTMISGKGIMTGASVRLPTRTVSADYSMTIQDSVVFVDASAASRTITLPAASDMTGRIITLVKIGTTTNSMAVNAGGSGNVQIEGNSMTTFNMNGEDDFIQLISDGTTWRQASRSHSRKRADRFHLFDATLNDKAAAFDVSLIGAGQIRNYKLPDVNANVIPALPTAATTETGSGAVVRQSSPSITSPTVSTGVAANGSGLKHQNVTTGSIAGSGSAGVTLTWTTAFADASYTPVCSVQESTASTSTLRVHHIETIAAASVTVRVANDGGGALTGTLYCIAIHN